MGDVFGLCQYGRREQDVDAMLQLYEAQDELMMLVGSGRYVSGVVIEHTCCALFGLASHIAQYPRVFLHVKVVCSSIVIPFLQLLQSAVPGR